MSETPSPTASNGDRDHRGRFTAGNRAARGNPHAKAIGELRSALLQAVTPEDMQAIAAKLVALAREGDVRAIKELLDRTLGKPQEADLIERIEQLEQLLSERNQG